MRQVRAGHDLVDRNVLKAVPVKKLPRAANNVFLDSFAVTRRITPAQSLHDAASPVHKKYYLEHILTGWFYAGGKKAHKISGGR